MTVYNPRLGQIGNRVCQRREELGLTGTELAIQADMAASTLSKIENGQRNVGIDSLCAIAKALKVPLSYLQPEDLDVYLEDDAEVISLNRKLSLLPPDQRALMLAMFNAQLDSLTRITPAKSKN